MPGPWGLPFGCREHPAGMWEHVSAAADKYWEKEWYQYSPNPVNGIALLANTERAHQSRDEMSYHASAIDRRGAYWLFYVDHLAMCGWSGATQPFGEELECGCVVYANTCQGDGCAPALQEHQVEWVPAGGAFCCSCGIPDPCGELGATPTYDAPGIYVVALVPPWSRRRQRTEPRPVCVWSHAYDVTEDPPSLRDVWNDFGEDVEDLFEYGDMAGDPLTGPLWFPEGTA